VAILRDPCVAITDSKAQTGLVLVKKRLLLTPVFQDITSKYKFSIIIKFLLFTKNDDFDKSTQPSLKLKKVWNV